MSAVEPVQGKESLRQRNAPLQTNSESEARRTVLELNALEEKKDVKNEKDKKTFGRTPDGTGNTNLSKLTGLAVNLTLVHSLHRSVYS